MGSVAASGCLWTAPGCCAPSGQGFGTNLRMRATPPDLFFRFVIISCVSWEISRSRGGSSLQEAPGSVELRPRRSQQVRGSLQPQNGGLRALEEAWMATFGLRHFPVKSDVFLCYFGRVKGSLRVVTKSRVIQGGAGKPRAPDRWPESSGRGLENDFLIEAFSVKSARSQLFWVVSRWLQEVSSCVQGSLRRSGEAHSSRTVA